jgi:hypothetical protein
LAAEFIGTFALIFIVLLCHKSDRRVMRWQQGQRGRTRAIARAMTVRTEVIEVAT